MKNNSRRKKLSIWDSPWMKYDLRTDINKLSSHLAKYFSVFVKMRNCMPENYDKLGNNVHSYILKYSME